MVGWDVDRQTGRQLPFDISAGRACRCANHLASCVDSGLARKPVHTTCPCVCVPACLPACPRLPPPPQIKTRDELIIKPLTAQEAGDARDALAKALYSGVWARWRSGRV